MDVNETLRQMRKALANFDAAAPNSPEEFAAAAMLADDFRNLDEWLSRGNFLPAEWTRNSAPTSNSVRPEGGW